jgi:hypothetical protein
MFVERVTSNIFVSVVMHGYKMLDCISVTGIFEIHSDEKIKPEWYMYIGNDITYKSAEQNSVITWIYY